MGKFDGDFSRQLLSYKHALPSTEQWDDYINHDEWTNGQVVTELIMFNRKTFLCHPHIRCNLPILNFEAQDFP